MAKVGNPRVSDRYDRAVSALDKCVFCDLKDKYIIAEEGGMVLTVNLFPYLDGHVLIIPRRHIEKFHELTAMEWVAVGKLTTLGIDLLKKGFGIEDSNILYREGGVGSGKSLGHLHLHIMPCVPGFLERNQKGICYNYQELKLSSLDVAVKLRAHDCSNGETRPATVGNNIDYMKRACLLCNKSTCGYKTGCVMVKNGKVVAEGWNATLPGEIYCKNGECIREKENLHGGKDIEKVCSIHAEAYAVAECARVGVSLEGTDVYLTTFPCVICARLLAKCGIGRLFYMSDYMGGKLGESLLVKNGVKIQQIKEEDVWK